MDENPYQSPAADLGKDGRVRKNSLWWKLYFWFYMSLIVLTLLAIPLTDGLSLFDYADLFISMIGAAGLFGFAYYKAILTEIFWRYYFYLLLMESAVYVVVWPAANIQRYGMDTEFGWSYFFELCFVGALIYAVYAYSHRCKFLWNKP